MKLIYLILTCLILSTVSLGLTGCNTVAGFGQDVQKTGSAIQRAAD